MSAEWDLVGQVGAISKMRKRWIVKIAENKYKKDETGNWYKAYTLWFACMSDFHPNVKVGDTVMASGVFLPSLNDNFDYMLSIRHIGVIQKDPDKEDEYPDMDDVVSDDSEVVALLDHLPEWQIQKGS